MKKKLSAGEIRTLLRAADPLRDDDGPREAEVARWRRAVLAEARPRARAPRWRWAPALATAVLLLLAFHVGFTLLDSDRHVADSTGLAASREVPPPVDAEEPGRRQQVQFVTANGTRVIWVLSSDLSL